MLGLASDFDGTLYFHDRNGYKENDLTKIKEFQKEGHLFGICTGRPLISIEESIKDKVDLDFYIVSSGAIILDKQKNILFEKTIEKEMMIDLYQRFFNNTIVFIQGENKIYSSNLNHHEHIIINDPKKIEGKIYGISLNAFHEEKAKEICSQINQDYPSLIAFQNKENIDIVKKGCSKGIGIKIIKEKMHLDKIAAIGDSYNDIPMLQVADLSFTFHDSPNQVKKEATHCVNDIEQAILLYNFSF